MELTTGAAATECLGFLPFFHQLGSHTPQVGPSDQAPTACKVKKWLCVSILPKTSRAER